MIASLRPYPAMKDSGVPWLGEVPEHWEVRESRHLARLLKGAGGIEGGRSRGRLLVRSLW